MTVETSATIERSRVRSSAARFRARPWTLSDVALFVSPLLTIGAAGTPVEILCWIMIPGLLIAGRPILNRRRLPALAAPDILLLLAMVAAAVSYLLSDYRETAMVPSLYFVAYYSLVLVSVLAINSYRQVGVFLSGASLAFAILLIRSLLLPESAQSDAGLTGVLGQENATGSMAATAIVVMLTLQRLYQLGYATTFNTRPVRIALAVMPFLAGLVLLLSASRGASLACAIFLAMWIIPAARHIELPGRLLVGIGTIMFAMLSWSRVTDLFVFRRFHYLAYELNLVAMPPTGRHYDAIDVRGLLVDRAVTVFREYPYFGAGLGTFREFSEFVYTHTTFYEFLYSLGLAGTVPAVLVLVAVVWRFSTRFLGKSRHRALSWVMLSLLTYFIFQGMTLPLTTSRIHMVLLIAAFASARLLKFRPNGGVGDVLVPSRIAARNAS